MTPYGPAPLAATASATVAVALSVTDGAGAPVIASSAIGLPGNPSGPTVVTNSAETPTVYDDTAASQTTHTYATTIDAVLNGGTVVYDQTFNLPYSDPQVQAAVAQAQASLRNDGASAGASTLASSNLVVTNSNTATATTGSNTAPGVITSSTVLGPDYIGPNTSTLLSSGPNAHGYFYVLAGQTDVNINTSTTTTVDRTVTTTSTDLLSQQYLITGTPMAAAASTTPLVSSSAAGVEGNMASFVNTISGGITSNGVSVLFASTAANLSPADTNTTSDLFLKNTTTGAVTLISTNAAGVRPNADVFYGSIDGDGNMAAFTTIATNIDARATDGNSHL